MTDSIGPLYGEATRALQDHFDSRRLADRLVELQDQSGLWNYPVHPTEGKLEPDLHNTMMVSLAYDELRERSVGTRWEALFTE